MYSPELDDPGIWDPSSKKYLPKKTPLHHPKIIAIRVA
jgi:hypothetical protein